MRETLNPSDYDYETELSGAKLRIECGSWVLGNRVERLLDEFYYVGFNRYWQSKYNNRVLYDYEPFCTEGFNLGFNIYFKEDAKAQYFLYLINREFESLIKLEKIYKENIDLKTELGKRVKELQEV